MPKSNSRQAATFSRRSVSSDLALIRFLYYFSYHAYHFTCTKCNCDLDHTARDVGGKLYCLPCHDKMEIPICATCRRPIEGRCVNAMGKQFHPEHFVCVACERPFANSKVRLQLQIKSSRFLVFSRSE